MKPAIVLDYYGLLHEGVGANGDIKINCPFHAENVNSLSINLKNGKFYCFGCDASGDIVDFIFAIDDNINNRLSAMLKYEKITSGEDDGNYEYTKPNYNKLREKAKIFFESLPSPSWDYITNHYMIDNRGFNANILKKFDVKINQSSSYPVIIPLYEQDKFIGYIQRRVDGGEPKYLYNSGYRKNKSVVGKLEKGTIMVVEGIMDLMKAHQFGFTNACAICGWKTSDTQMEKISKYAKFVISALDNTPTGHDGSMLLYKHFKGKFIRFQYQNSISDIGEMNKYQFNFCLNKTRKKAKQFYSKMEVINDG